MATVQKSSKINFYKFVQVKDPSGSANPDIKDSDIALAKSINTSTRAINNLGDTVNSLGNVLVDLKKVNLSNLEAQRAQKTKFKAEYTKPQKQQKQGGLVSGLLAKSGSFLEGLLGLFGNLFKIAVVIPVLKWLSDPKNQDTIVKVLDVIKTVVQFIFDWAKWSITTTIDGLYDLLKDDATWQDRLLGFGKAVVGIGSIVLGIRYLKNPTKIITDIAKGIRALIKFVTGGGGGRPGRGGRRRGGLGKVLLGTGLVIGAGMGINALNNRDEEKSQGGSVKNLPSRSQGGWISGPQSGYKVSLDGGRSTSFIGHGTEYVARKSNGGAFVVPFNTPGTKTQPHLTQKRLGEAKSQGYKVPGRSQGGKVPEMSIGGAMGAVGNWWNNLTGGGGKPSKPTTNEPVSEKGQKEKPVIGAGLKAVAAGGKWALDKGFTVAEHPNFKKNDYSGSGPNRGIGFNKNGGERVGRHSGGSLHYKGLAIDVTDWRPGAWKARTAQLAEEAYQLRDKMKLSQIITDGWGQWYKGSGKSGPGRLGHAEHLHLGFLDGISSGIQGSSGTTNMPAAAGGYGAILDLIGKRESDNVGGYNAVNQGGADGGHTALGYSGDYRKAPFNPSGKELTSMTVQEIMDKQYDDRSMSPQQWKESGKLHAVGRYQFIGSTLKSLVDQGVVSPKDQFSPATQNKLGVALVKQTGGNVSRLKSTWIGLQHESDSAVSSAISAGGATTSGGYSAGSGSMSASNSSSSASSGSLGNMILGGPTTSVRGGRSDRAAPQREAEIRAQGRRGSLSKSTEERNEARTRINERTREMVGAVIEQVGQSNGMNSQMVAQAQQAVQMAIQAGQRSAPPVVVGSRGGGGGGAGGSSIGGALVGTAAALLGSTNNPLRGIFK
ncbi:hypothetical protein WH070310_013 [Cyanophage S-RIM12_WH_07_0310]|uniref:Uncharacterized protein n=1 Tax=Cyanophage S-RIM12_WH_07_0310 TaxID=2928624 RepID=A0A1D7T0X3_9CAUD|nr:hypothetical protein WH070310_013 [Cyanophage S-RIM12_WH_07_0310]